MTVFGVDDYDKDVPNDFWDRKVFIADEALAVNADLAYVKDYAFDNREKEWRYFGDLLYFGHEWNPGVCGLILSRNFDSTTFRLLSMIHPEFFESGHVDAPQETSEWTRAQRLKRRPARPCGGIEFQSHWLYKQGMHWLTPVYAFTTYWLLKQLAIELDPTTFKWMLVWEWS